MENTTDNRANAEDQVKRWALLADSDRIRALELAYLSTAKQLDRTAIQLDAALKVATSTLSKAAPQVPEVDPAVMRDALRGLKFSP